MPGGAPVGNKNPVQGKRWRDALHKALVRFKRDAPNEVKAGEALYKIAELVVQRAVDGDWDSINEIANRTDGKPAQSLTVAGDSENPLESRHTVEFVNGAHSAADKT